MKTLIKLIAILTVLFMFGCAQAPVITPEPEVVQDIKSIVNVRHCVQSETADHSYESAIDPKVIFDTWIEKPELHKGDWMLMEMAYRNPDITSDIPAALLVRQTGYVVGFSYLQGGEPRLFWYNPETSCYEEKEIDREHLTSFRNDLLRIIDGYKI